MSVPLAYTLLKGYIMFERSHFVVLVVTCCTSMQSMHGDKRQRGFCFYPSQRDAVEAQMWCTWTRLFLSSSVTWCKFCFFSHA